MGVKFSLAKPEFEAKKLYNYIKNVTKNSKDFMFTKLELPINKEIYTKIKKEDFGVVKEKLIEIVKSSAENRKNIQKSLPKIKKEWGKIEKRLFNTIKEVTSHKIEGVFICKFLTAYKSGGYDRQTNNLWIYSSGDKQSFWGITHELLHIHCWKIWDNLIEDYDWEEAWKFSEVYLELLLRDTKISFVLPREERKIKFWSEVEPLAKKILPLWKRRKDFDSFLISSFKLLGLKGKLKK